MEMEMAAQRIYKNAASVTIGRQPPGEQMLTLI